MQPWLAAHARKALSTTSVMRCEVQAFPAQTAALPDGLRMVPCGTMTDTGSIHPKLHQLTCFEPGESHIPSFNGISVPIRHRRQ